MPTHDTSTNGRRWFDHPSILPISSTKHFKLFDENIGTFELPAFLMRLQKSEASEFGDILSLHLSAHVMNDQWKTDT